MPEPQNAIPFPCYAIMSNDCKGGVVMPRDDGSLPSVGGPHLSIEVIHALREHPAKEGEEEMLRAGTTISRQSLSQPPVQWLRELAE